MSEVLQDAEGFRLMPPTGLRPEEVRLALLLGSSCTPAVTMTSLAPAGVSILSQKETRSRSQWVAMRRDGWFSQLPTPASSPSTLSLHPCSILILGGSGPGPQGALEIAAHVG